MKAKNNQKISKYETVEKGIQYDNQNKKYLLTLYIGKDKKGKQVRKFEMFTRLDEARKRKKEFHAEKRLNKAPKALEKIKLDSFLELYYNSLIGRSPATLDGYRRICNRIKTHCISKKYLQDVEKKDILSYISYLQQSTKMKAQSINKDLIFLNGAFKRALKDELCERNPVKLVDKLPIVEKFTADFYSIEEIKEILYLLENYPNRNVKLVFYFGIFLGLRRGEMVGLKWESVHFEEKSIEIKNNRINVNGEIIDKSPKSKTSRRTLDISSFPILFNFLLEIKKWQENTFDSCDYVMVNSQTSLPLSPQNLKDRIDIFYKKFSIRKIRIHDLRHTCASVAISGGASVRDVSTALGHTDTRITEKIYIHTLKKTANNNAARALSNLLN